MHGHHRRRCDALVHHAGQRGDRRNHDARGAREGRPATSAAASVDRRAGAAVRLLPERPDPHGEGVARPQSESHRRRDPRRHGRRAVPLHDVLPDSASHQARRARPWLGRERRMSDTTLQLPRAVEEALRRANPALTRRGFLASSGALVVTLASSSLPGGRALAQAVNAGRAGPYPDRDFLQLDTWIVIHPNNTATFYVGKTDGGQGTGTAFRQMMSDELDIAYDKTSLVMGATDVTPDQGGSGGSDAIERDGWPMRRVAAEGRRVLLELGSQRLGTPVADLAVSNGTISAKNDPSKRVTYAELGGGKRFDVTLTGRNVDATTGTAAVKPVQELRVVGQSVPRYDIPGKVDGSLTWAVDMKVPGMLHARNVRP